MHRTLQAFPGPAGWTRAQTALQFLFALLAAMIVWAGASHAASDHAALLEPEDPDGPALGAPSVLEPMEIFAYADNLPWVYVEVDGTEILSLCPNPVTRGFVHLLRARNALLNDTIPAHLRSGLTVPSLVVLFDAPDSVDLERGELYPKYLLTDDEQLSRRRPPDRPQVFWAEDRDLAALCANLRYGPPSDQVLSRRWPYSVAGALRFMLERQYPQLPAWVVVGLEGHLRECTWLEKDRSFELEPVPWVSASATRALLKNPKTPVTLLSLPELFASSPEEHARATGDTYSLFEVQSALFVRWALEHNWRERRDAFWRFVLRTVDEPVTEELFREHFRMSFAAAEDALRDYLGEAIYREVTVTLPRRWKSGRITMRSATEDEIGRIKAEWDRLRARNLEKDNPTAVAAALERARRAARRGYELGKADPRLIAVRGFVERDSGDSELARAYLEEAARADVARPSVYLELARLRLEHALAHPGSPFGSISESQLEAILQPLDVARTKVPLLPEVYLLTAEACSASAALPHPRQLRMLAEGARLFPRHSELVCRVAELHAANGLRHEALQMVMHSLALGPDRVARERLQNLHASLSDPIQFRLRTSSSAP